MRRRLYELTWALVIAVFILAVTIESRQQFTISFGTSVTILDTTSTGAVTGDSFALPGGAAAVVGFAHVNETAPSAVTVTFQVSNDGTNWTALVNSTGTSASPNIAGLNNTGVIPWKFIRATQTSRTGGSRTIVTASVQRAFQVTSQAVNLTNANIGLAAGSSSAPSLYNAADTDTGLYFASGTSPRMIRDATSVQQWEAVRSLFFQRIEPATDNATDIGTTTGRWRDAFLSSSIRIGTSPASAGSVRLPHGGSILARQSTDSADTTILSYGSVATDQIVVGNSGINIRIRSNLGTPTTLANNEWWVQCTGTSPSRVCAIMVQDGGATRTIGSMTY